MKSLNISHALKPSLTWVQQLPCAVKEITVAAVLEHCLCLLFQSLYSLCDDEVTFQMCWVYSSRSFMCECDVRITEPCPQQAEVRDSSNWRRTSCLFAKLSWLRKTLCQTQDCAKQKTLCLLKKMSNDNDGDEETPQPETLFQLLITCQTTFDSLILSPSLSKCWSVLAQPLRFSMSSHVFSEVLYPFHLMR
jgi:hypothetical protein